MTLVTFYLASKPPKTVAEMQCDVIPRVDELVVFDSCYIVTHVIWEMSTTRVKRVVVRLALHMG